ncbi:MAG: hypothetical protein ACI9RP_003036, partial [Cyclobacteriaceae bacterium]
YGPTTTKVFTESGLIFNKLDTIYVDTSQYRIERFAFTDRLNREYQDLGNIGTAMFPLFFQAPRLSGLRSGYSAYDPIVRQPEERQYFDSKSPFIDLGVVLGGRGRSLIDVMYTQNINPNLNIGFEINRLNIDKQLGATRNEGDRNLESTQLNFFTQYKHPEKPYELVAYVNQLTHDVQEVGGAFFTDSATNSEKFQYQDAAILLAGATAKETRQDVHVYHAFGLFKQFQIYHRFDVNIQRVTYRDAQDVSNNVFSTYTDFYPSFLIDNDSTFQSSDFSAIQNEVGLKGDIESVYYRFYIRNRRVNHDWLYLQDTGPVNEVYLGGLSKFNWRDVFQVEALAEIMQTGDYLLQGKLSSQLINASYRSQLYQPTSLEQQYFGNHFVWDNGFSSTFVNELKVDLSVDWNRFEIKPNASFTTLNNYVYFDTLSLPRQTQDPLLISRIGLDLNFKLLTNAEEDEAFHFENQGFFTQVTGSESSAYPVPQWFANARWYWKGKWFENAIPIQIGFDVHAKTGYFARAYSPSIQQFHVQNDERLKGYFTIDPFISMQVNRVYLFFKGTHINMPVEDGYFITPFYPGQRRVFDFGVRWLFFD